MKRCTTMSKSVASHWFYMAEDLNSPIQKRQCVIQGRRWEEKIIIFNTRVSLWRMDWVALLFYILYMFFYSLLISKQDRYLWTEPSVAEPIYMHTFICLIAFINPHSGAHASWSNAHQKIITTLLSKEACFLITRTRICTLSGIPHRLQECIKPITPYCLVFLCTICITENGIQTAFV
jgi:hypothetical protein